MKIEPKDRFNDWQIDQAIEHMESVIEGARNSNQSAEDALQTAYLSLMQTPHMHYAGTLAGKHIDECAKCGKDIRNPIHQQQG